MSKFSEEWISAMAAARQLRMPCIVAINVMMKNGVRILQAGSMPTRYYAEDVNTLAEMNGIAESGANVPDETIMPQERQMGPIVPNRKYEPPALIWLRQYMTENGGSVKASEAYKSGKDAGHARSTLSRAKLLLGISNHRVGFGGGSIWNWPLTAHAISGVVTTLYGKVEA